MNHLNFTQEHLTVLRALENQHLTSFQLLKKVDSISLILVLYTLIDDLEGMGILKSYTKENEKYHCTA